MIAILDYGAGNIRSVKKALEHIGCDCRITDNREEILSADAAVLPGQGSFGDCMSSMERGGMKDTVIEFISTGKPFLGICVGLQLLFDGSEESEGTDGLGLFRGMIKRIPGGEGLKIPHMGWNSLNVSAGSRLLSGLGEEPFVYFVHSYYLDAEDKSIVSAQTEYGVTIDAAIERGNVFATQFHPEKSGETGLRILRNFVSIAGGEADVR